MDVASATAKKTDYKKKLINLINQTAYSRSKFKVFSDFIEMSAITFSNPLDFVHREEREARYLSIINSYDKKHQHSFPLMLFYLTEALEEKTSTSGPEDVLGVIFHELNLHNERKGQFFTPQAISDMMAMMICGDDKQKAIEEKGFIHVCEPTVGSGVMLTSFCKAMQKEGLNYCTQLVVTAIDCDISCVHMAYLQLSLYGVPAVVIHGNTITGEEWSRWYTPVYLMNNWIWRASCGICNKYYEEDEKIKFALEPSYAFFRQIFGYPQKTTDSEELPEAFVEKPHEVFEIKQLSF